MFHSKDHLTVAGQSIYARLTGQCYNDTFFPGTNLPSFKPVATQQDLPTPFITPPQPSEQKC